MAEFAKNPQRLTPYANFRFKVKVDGRHVAGVSQVSGVSQAVEPVKVRGGAAGPIVPGQTDFSPITFARGMTEDKAFIEWANKLWDYGGHSQKDAPAADFCKDLTLEVYNEAGQMVLSYLVYKAWPSEFKTLSELDSVGDAVALETMTIQHEGWARVGG